MRSRLRGWLDRQEARWTGLAEGKVPMRAVKRAGCPCMDGAKMAALVELYFPYHTVVPKVLQYLRTEPTHSRLLLGT